jgi:ferrous iron transport protein A
MNAIVKTLLELPTGQSAKIAVVSESNLTCKLLNLGLLPGTEVTMVRKAPFGGAYYIKLGSHQLAVRDEEAASISVEF